MDIEKRYKEYRYYRKGDYRIANGIMNILNLPPKARIADIGAGYGKYSEMLASYGYEVHAIEPSKLMKKNIQTVTGVHWTECYAENILLENNFVDASIVIFSIHHFKNVDKAISEILRISKNKKILILTYDPAIAIKHWIFDYFPELKKYLEEYFWSIDHYKKKFLEEYSLLLKVKKFLLPEDLVDLFFGALWKRPQLILNKDIRNAISLFNTVDNTYLSRGLSQLKSDLYNNNWHKKYQNILLLDEYDAGCRFLYT